MLKLINILIFAATVKKINLLMVGEFENQTDLSLCEIPLKSFLLEHEYGKKVYFNYFIEKCETQVVAGFNYRVTLKIDEQICSVTLYEDLEKPPNIELNDNYQTDVICFSIEKN